MKKQYTMGFIKERVNSHIKNKGAMLTSFTETVAQGVRDVTMDFDMPSTKKERMIVPVVKDVYGYNFLCPPDIKGSKVVGTRYTGQQCAYSPQFVIPDRFNREHQIRADDLFTVDRTDDVRILRTTMNYGDPSMYIADLSGTLGWTATGDTTGITHEDYRYIIGDGSLRFDLNQGDTNAGLTNLNIGTDVDISEFVTGSDSGSFYLFLFMPQVAGIDSINAEFGNDPANHYSITINGQADRQPFVKGWNVLKFDIRNSTEVGTVVNTQISYLSLNINKSASTQAISGFLLNGVSIVPNKYFYLEYYSESVWYNDQQEEMAEPELDTDYIEATSSEINAYIYKVAHNAAFDVKLPAYEIDRLETKAKNALVQVGQMNPGEARIIVDKY